MTKPMLKIIDTVLLTIAALFFFVMFMIMAADSAPFGSIILLFLSVAFFGLAGYRISHKA